MNKCTYIVIGIGLIAGGKAFAHSCDISNILLQPGGYYAFPFKDTFTDCLPSCSGPYYKTLMHESGVQSQKKSNEYYNNLLHCPCKKQFLFQALLYGCIADKGFNNDKQKVPLSTVVFSRPFQVQDVNLASKLSNEGKLTLPSMPGMMPPFGSNRNEQYIALLAPTQVNIQSELREVGLNLTGMYHFRFPGTKKLVGVLGLLAPIRSQAHRMTIAYQDGTLLSAVVPPSTPSGQTTLTQFFSNFESVDDFFMRGVVEPKGLQFNKWQRRTNIGDIVALTALDLAFCSDVLDACLVGAQWVFPTGNKQKGDVVWPIELGNGGAYQCEPFINMYIGASCWINPVLYAGGRFSTNYSGVRRIPKLKSGNANESLSDTEVIIPPGFENYIVAPNSSFNKFDTSILQLADEAVKVKISPGNQWLFRVGNFVEGFLLDCLDLGIFYDVYMQGKEKLTPKTIGVFDTDLLTRYSRTTQQLISWRLGYTHDDYLEAYVGSQHVFAGKNVSQDNKIYASITAYF